METNQWRKFEDLGVQDILGKEYYVSLAPGGRLLLTDKELADNAPDLLRFRITEDVMRMSEEERRELARQQWVSEKDLMNELLTETTKGE